MKHEKECWLSTGNERLVCCVSPEVGGFIRDGHFLKHWIITLLILVSVTTMCLHNDS